MQNSALAESKLSEDSIVKMEATWQSGTPRVIGGFVTDKNPVEFIKMRTRKQIAEQKFQEKDEEPIVVVEVKDRYQNKLWASKQTISLQNLRDEKYLVEVDKVKPYEEPRIKKRLRERNSSQFGIDDYYDEEDDFPPVDEWEEGLFDDVKHNFSKRHNSTDANVVKTVTLKDIYLEANFQLKQPLKLHASLDNNMP